MTSDTASEAGSESGSAERRFMEGVVRSEAIARFESELSEACVATELLGVLGSHLDASLHEHTWGRVQAAFATYLATDLDAHDRDVTDLMLFLAGVDNESSDYITDGLMNSPRVARFMRRALAMYQAQIVRAFEVWRERPDDWRSIEPRLVLEDPGDESVEQAIAQIAIEKNNGERLYLETPTDSLVALISALMRVVRRMPDWTQASSARRLELATEAATVFRDLQSTATEPADAANARESNPSDDDAG